MHPRARASRRRSQAAFFESLEERIAFDVYTVSNASDSGTGSLRQAITNANASGLPDSIVFSSFFSTPRVISLSTVLPQINNTGGLTITGPGATLLTVQRSGGAPTSFGVFSSVNSSLNISGMTVSSGNSVGNGAGVQAAGVSPNVTLDGMVFSSNTTTVDGGAISLNNNGTLTLRNSMLTNNTARIGGGIFFVSGGSLVIDNCTISGNDSVGVAGDGGGVYFSGVASANPPAGFVASTLLIRNTTFDGNTATRHGGGVALDNFVGTLLVQNSTFSANSAVSSGGAIVETGGSGLVNLQNATVSGNNAGTSGGGIAVIGGSGGITLQNSTVTLNSASGAAAGQGGGGIARTTLIAGVINISNSVVSANTNFNGPDVYRANANTTSNVNFSAIGSNTGFALSGANNLAFGANLMLAGLANNGGPTRTHAVTAGSPLSNAGSNALIPAGMTTDQRGPGFPRISGSSVDIGAFERDAVAPSVLSSEFTYLNAPQSLRFTFSEDVSGSIGVPDLTLRNLTTAADVPGASISLSYDAVTNTAIFRFPTFPNGALPDGNYRATLAASGIRDASQNPLAANHVFNFFFLAGDANHDRSVGFADLVILAQNYGTTARDFAHGNLNYDAQGNVDFGDLVQLAQRYGASLPAAADVVEEPILAAASPPIRQSAAKRSLFNSTPVARRKA
jgi:predicted outer membrane repeat protein